MRIDGHVHIVGNGSGGTGCWLQARGITRLGVPWLLRSIGLPASALRGDLDRLYAERLLKLVRESSLDAIVILAQEQPYREDGTVVEDSASFYVPNEYVLGLAQKHPEFIPAVSIHPARRDAMDELERCLAQGARILKCLPNCQNIDWNSPRYTPFLERMAAAKMILLAHTGSERTLPQLAPELAHPHTLMRALEIGVSCIAAHGATGMMVLGPDYFDEFAAMTERFPKLYGDNSALLGANLRLKPRVLRRMLRPELQARILHGSDLPVPVDGILPWLSGLITEGECIRSLVTRNPLERDAQLKRALGFGEGTFTRLGELLGRT